MKHLFLLNGPPHSGKDTVADYLCELLGMDRVRAQHCKFAEPLKAATVALLGVFNGRLPGTDWGRYDPVKDEPHPDCFGKTPRQVAIAVSEELCKPLWGQGFFGELAAREIKDSLDYTDVFVFSDCGFQPEVDALLLNLPKDHEWTVHLWHIYRPNTTFLGDSRGWINHAGTALPRSILNVGSKDDLKIEILQAIKESNL